MHSKAISVEVYLREFPEKRIVPMTQLRKSLKK
jgi:hypothetical protein